MKIPIPIESCFRADEIVRIGRALKRWGDRVYYRKRILEVIDAGLPDYPRPLKKIERTYKGISLKKIIKGLLP